MVVWQAHPEVWLLVFGAASVAWFMLRVVEPKAVKAGYQPISLGQKFWYVLATASMWLVSDWPIHEVAENYLYFVHMLQHLLLSMLIPAMFLLSLPRWLFELVIVPNGRVWRFVKKFSKPLVAGIIFNALTLLLHWPLLVDMSANNGALHFLLHLLVFSAGLLMWMPVIGPVAEWRLPPIGQCIYLFAMSIVPTVPGGWLVFAEQVVYPHYDIADRLFGIDAITDQQAAGVVMKLVGGFFLWGVIVVIFSKWAKTEMDKDLSGQRAQVSASQVR